MKAFIFLPGFLLLFLQALPADPVIVHEWGTFTCLQDANGKTIGGINVDDEPVPYFVSSVAIGVAPQYGSRSSNLGLPPYREDKAWISGDPQVTMRLETPVLYFYPPKGQSPQSVPPLNVHVDFHGGVLSQFYPRADFSGLPLINYPGHPEISGKFPYIDKATGITETTTTSLDWKGVRLGSTEKPIEIDDKVWTTPREVNASVLQVKFSEKDNLGAIQEYTQAEHFLFYRGVGHLNSPLFVGHGETNGNPALMIESPLMEGRGLGEKLKWGWLVQIRANGTCAYRSLDHPESSPVVFHMTLSYPITPASFTDADFSADNLVQLKASMQKVLVKQGLYPDEASAMLRTWELSYFKSPGLRFFYTVPETWVDKVLPLKITGAPTKVTRVMIGRIEIVTEAQQAALERLAGGPCPDLPAFKKAALTALQESKMSDTDKEAFYCGEKPLSELGISIPPLIQDYLSLGRFRDALVMDEYLRRSSSALLQFIQDNQIAPQGMKLSHVVWLPISPDVTLKNPGKSSSSGLHY